MRNSLFKLCAVIVFGFVFLSPVISDASVGVGVQGGWTYKGQGFTGAKSPVPYYGFELLGGIAASDAFQLGAFFDKSILYFDSGNTGSNKFFGGVMRISVPAVKAFFVDFKVGSSTTDDGTVQSDSAMGFGFGAGFRIPIAGKLTMVPRGQYRSLPFNVGSTSTAQAVIDASLMFAFLF